VYIEITTNKPPIKVRKDKTSPPNVTAKIAENTTSIVIITAALVDSKIACDHV
jgi:hypothetical protein